MTILDQLEASDDPYMDAGMVGWLQNFSRQNLWRVAEWYTLDDLISDGLMCYYKCRARYKEFDKPNPTDEERRWFMALVQTTFTNFIYSKAMKAPYGTEFVPAQLKRGEETEESFWGRVLPDQEEETTIQMMIKQAPAEIAALIERLVGDGAAMIEHRRTRVVSRLVKNNRVRLQRRRRRHRETTNELYCRLLGLNPYKIDIVEAARRYFVSGEIDPALTDESRFA